jgi:hypothetical protein
VGNKVQDGHSVAARNMAESGASTEAWNNQKSMRLPSEAGTDVVAAVQNQDSSIDIRTNHRAQETVIDHNVDIMRESPHGLNPTSHMESGDVVNWQLQHTPITQDNVDVLKSDMADPVKRLPPDKTLTKEAKVAAAESDLFFQAAKQTGRRGSRGAKALKLLKKAGKFGLAAIPFLGTWLGHASAAEAAASGDYAGAALDEAGNIPVAGDLLDAGRGGWALGEAIDEGLGITDLAQEDGKKAEAIAKKLGASDDTAMYIGATAAGLASVGLVLNPIELTKRKYQEWKNGR